MGLFNLFTKGKSLENPANRLTPAIINSTNRRSGELSPDGAMRLTVVYACVRVIAETISSLPIHVYTKEGKNRTKATEHYAYQLLHNEPNEWQTPSQLWDYVLSSVLLTGNGFIYIERNNGAVPVALIPINTTDIQVKRENGLKYYIYQGNQIISDEDMIHIYGMSCDGLTGVSPVSYAATAINLGLSAEQYGLNYFGNGANLGGTLETAAELTDNQIKAIQNAWEGASGVDNSHKVKLLPFGLKYSPLTINNQDSQFIDSRRFSVEEICRIYKVPQHMVQSLERATFSNIEQQSLDFYQNTIRPWIVKIEQQINRKLFLTSEKYKFTCEFNLDGLLRADIQTRYAAYSVGRQQGFLSVNEIREKENLNPIPNGDIYLSPLNMTPAQQEQQQEQEKVDTQEEKETENETTN
jgi:HK97 family phage portal protein